MTQVAAKYIATLNIRRKKVTTKVIKRNTSLGIYILAAGQGSDKNWYQPCCRGVSLEISGDLPLPKLFCGVGILCRWAWCGCAAVPLFKELQNGWGWKGSLEVICSSLPAPAGTPHKIGWFHVYTFVWNAEGCTCYNSKISGNYEFII